MFTISNEPNAAQEHTRVSAAAYTTQYTAPVRQMSGGCACRHTAGGERLLLFANEICGARQRTCVSAAAHATQDAPPTIDAHESPPSPVQRDPSPTASGTSAQVSGGCAVNDF